MPTTLSTKNIKKTVPSWFRKAKRVVNVGLVPVAVTTIKGLWEGDDTQLNKILLVITVTLPGLLEIIGLLLAEEPDDTEEIL